tara:strand:- start:47 stop:1375 length:1329 start_codon:yes stop_codon:yes gene_type:complete
MAVEYSEIMAGAAMFYTNRELDFYTKDADSLLEWLKDAHKTISNPQNVRYGANRTQFIDYMDQGRWARLQRLSEQKRKEYLTNAVQGISAAKAIKKWLSRDHNERDDVKAEKIYITGNKWPKPVDKFQISAFGFDDYNSSDIIVKTKGLNFYGVSLKKKPKENSADPTLINKAFDSILAGPGPGGIFTRIKREVQEARAEYFAGVVREAVEKDILSIPAAHLKWDDQKLFAAKERDKTKFERAYIDVKGNNSDGYETDPKNCRALAMKDFVNEGLAKKDNILFQKFSDVVEGNGEIFADTLINLVLKVKLYEKLAANKDLAKYNFAFALVTGVGNLTKVRGSKPVKFSPKVGVGKAVDLHTVLCGLRQLTANNKEYEIDVDFDKKEITDAAKIFFKISKDNVPILNLELRYKGKFTPQPQFLGTITDEFHTILTKECLVEAK